MGNESTGPLRQDGGYPVDHIGGYTGGQKSGSEGGGIDIFEASFDIQEEGGDVQSGSQEGFDLMSEGEAGVS